MISYLNYGSNTRGDASVGFFPIAPDGGVREAAAGSGSGDESVTRRGGLVDPAWFALCILFLAGRKR